MLVGIQILMTGSFSFLTPIVPLLLPDLGVTTAEGVAIWSGILGGATSFVAAFASQNIRAGVASDGVVERVPRAVDIARPGQGQVLDARRGAVDRPALVCFDGSAEVDRLAEHLEHAAERAGIEIRYYNIIYDLVDDMKKAMSGLLAPTLREERLGEARVLQVFAVSKVGKVAGCRVTDGTVERGANVRLIRDNVVIHEGKLSQLKRFKDDAKEVEAGQECGMAFENYQDMRQGDVIECYRVETVQRSL